MIPWLSMVLMSAPPVVGAVSVTTETVEVRAGSSDELRVTEQRSVLCDGKGTSCRTFVVPTFSSKGEDVIQRLNADVAFACYADWSIGEIVAAVARSDFAGLLDCSYVVGVNRNGLLEVSVTRNTLGAYPSTTTAAVRMRVKDGTPWRVADFLTPAQQKKAMGMCLSARREAIAGLHKEHPELGVDTLDREVLDGCDLERLRLSADRKLSFELAAHPHALAALATTIALDSREIGPLRSERAVAALPPKTSKRIKR